MNLNIAQLADDIRALAIQYPDALYNRESKDDPEAVGCLYTRGFVKNGPPTSGCIVGQAASKQPVFWGFLLSTEENVVDNSSVSSRFSNMLSRFNATDDGNPENWDESLVHWIDEVQYLQDEGEIWSEALKTADQRKALREQND
jgi:hypothetical protein